MLTLNHKLFVPGYFRGVVLLLFNCVNAFSEERVIGGQNARLGQFPSQVSIRFGTLGHFCGGTLVSLKDVVTASHCLAFGTRIIKTYMFIIAGEVRSGDVESSTQQKGLISKAIMHPMYNCDSFENDIGIIKLANALILTEFVKPIARATNYIPVGQECTIVGWGAKDPIAIEVSEVLQCARVYVLYRLHCEFRKFNRPFNDESMICAGDPKKKGVCLGDSGSPLICGGRIAGVTSASLMPCVVAGGGGRFSSTVYFGKFIDTFIEWDGISSLTHKLREFTENTSVVNCLFRNATALLILLTYI